MELSPELYQQAVEECNAQMEAIATFSGLTIERRGVWVWVTGETRKHHVALKGAGFKFAPKKEAWFWKPSFVPSVRKGRMATMQHIRDTYTDCCVRVSSDE